MIDRITWLGMLAKLVTPGDPVKAFQAMEAFLPFLADLPNEAFTSVSLRAVAMAERRLHIPDLREVAGPLEAWWKANRPALTALAPPRTEPELEPLSEPQRATLAQGLRDLAASLGAPEAPAQRQRGGRVISAEQLAAARADLAKRAGGG